MTTDSQTTDSASQTTAVKTPPKPGWMTTEFYFKLLAAGLSVAFASGVFTSDRELAIAGIVASVLTALGYTVSRTIVKTAAALLLAGLFSAPLISCHGSPGAEKARQIAWSCTGGVRQDLVDAVTPLATSAILAAASADGRLVDDSQLKRMFTGANLLTEAGAVVACAAERAFADLISPPAPAVGAPSASPLVVDPGELRRARQILRAGWGG